MYSRLYHAGDITLITPFWSNTCIDNLATYSDVDITAIADITDIAAAICCEHIAIGIALVICYQHIAVVIYIDIAISIAVGIVISNDNV